MAEFWESAFREKQLMWGSEPTRSALLARDAFIRWGAKDILIPGIGYGRNAAPFLDAGIAVTGIEVSDTAISLARTHAGLQIPIHRGSVADMPFDRHAYDGIFCHGLIYLLDTRAREKFIRDSYRQLAPGGHMIFTVISQKAPFYGQGQRLGEGRYERAPGLPMFFYDAESVRREFGPYGMVEFFEVDEPSGDTSLPFLAVVCRREVSPKVSAEEATQRLWEGYTEVRLEGAPDATELEALGTVLKASSTTILGLGDCALGDVGCQVIAHALAHNRSLRELWLFNNQIGDEGAQALGEALGSHPSLVTLCLNGNQVGDAGAASLATAIKSSARLEEVGLGHNRIGDVGAGLLAAALSAPASVTALNLNNNRLGDAAAQAFGEALHTGTSLKSLGLQHNFIGDLGAEALAVAIPHATTLQKLRLNHNRIGGAGMAALQSAVGQSPALNVVDTEGNLGSSA